MSTPIVILYNPQAGLASSQDELHRAITAMKSQGTPIRLLSLPRDKPWRVQIESLLEDGMGTFIAAGGDGTVNAIASCLLDTGCRLGIIPTGTMNHVARQLKIPLDMTAALEIIRQGRSELIDVAEVNDLPFLNFSSIGVYADSLMTRTEQQRLGWNQRLALFRSMLTIARFYKPLQLHFLKESQEVNVETPLFLISNNPLNIANATILSDQDQFQSSILHVAYLPSNGWVAQLRLGFSILFDKPIETALTPTGLSSFDIASQQECLSVSLDGDIRLMHPPLRYTSRPRAQCHFSQN